ncbi:MAG: glycosyltransferase family 4 protein [Thermoanaerobaculia bacterium]
MIRPRRVLYTLPNFVTAGSGQLLVHIVSNLDRDRYRPSVCVARLGDVPLEHHLRGLGVPLFETASTVAGKPWSTLFWRALQRSREFRGKGFDLWHSFHYLDDYSEPLIARLSGAKAWVYTKKNMSWNRRSWWLRSQLAHGIAAQNRDMLRDFFSSPSLRRKTQYVPSGVDVDRYCPLPEERDAAADLRAGCVAHLLPVKGQDTLVQAAAEVPGLQVLLAGRADEGEYARSIGQQIERLDLRDRVLTVGMVEGVDEFLRHLDIFVLPSLGRGRMEGCPVALLEAMSTGLACIATDIPGNRDLIVNDESGLLVPPEDPVTLAAALHRLADSPVLRRSLGGAARKRCVERFSTRQEAQRYMALYDEVLGTRE